MDSTGIVDDLKFWDYRSVYVKVEPYLIESILKSSLNSDEWSDVFNAKKWIPKIEKKLGIKL
jgi:hypothetical protein